MKCFISFMVFVIYINHATATKLIIESKSFPQSGIILLRYYNPKPLQIQIGKQLFTITNTQWPNYQKLTFFIDSEENLTINIIGNSNLNQYLELVGGWTYPTNPLKAFQTGADFFQFLNLKWSFYKSDNLSLLYNTPYRPQYHFSSMKNWLNDPNYDPFELLVSGVLFWGHAVSQDGIKWKHLPPALFPNQTLLSDKKFKVGGIFSGGGMVVDDQTLYIYYTDHYETESEKIEIQYQVVSLDGLYFDQPKLIIGQQPIKDISNDIRDPQISYNRKSLNYNLLLGTANIDENKQLIPSVIQFESKSLEGPWVFDEYIYKGPYLNSTTIECPNKFYLNDKGQEYVVLIFSINDIQLNSSYGLYVVGIENQFGLFVNITDVRKIDYGGNFYATQVFPNKNTDYVEAITWMQNWNKPYRYFGDQQYSCVMTLMRKMFLQNGLLYQYPIDNVINLRKYKIIDIISVGQMSFHVPQVSEIQIVYDQLFDFNLEIQFVNSITQKIILSYSAFYMNYKLIISEKQNQYTYLSQTLKNIGNQIYIAIYMDRGALEIFCNGGEIVFSERIKANSNQNDLLDFFIDHKQQWSVNAWELSHFY